MIPAPARYLIWMGGWESPGEELSPLVGLSLSRANGKRDYLYCLN